MRRLEGFDIHARQESLICSRRLELEPHADFDSPWIENGGDVRASETLPVLVVELLRRSVRIRRLQVGLQLFGTIEDRITIGELRSLHLIGNGRVQGLT